MTESEKLRFESKINRTDHCWLWTGCVGTKGYGYARSDGRNALAHRVAWQMYRGEIPSGLQIDHLCRNRKCVRPEHMELVTIRTNVLRGIGLSAINARKTHCIRGHEFIGENVKIWNGYRLCVPCRKAYKHSYDMAAKSRRLKQTT